MKHACAPRDESPSLLPPNAQRRLPRRARCLCKCARVATAFASYVSAQAAPSMATNPSNDRRIAPSERRERERKGRDTGQFDGTLRASSVGRGSPWPMSPFDGIFVKGTNKGDVEDIHHLAPARCSVRAQRSRVLRLLPRDSERRRA